MEGFSSHCILHCALRLNLGSLRGVETLPMEPGQDRGFVRPSRPPPPQISTHTWTMARPQRRGGNLLVQAGRMALNVERAGTPCHKFLRSSRICTAGEIRNV